MFLSFPVGELYGASGACTGVVVGTSCREDEGVGFHLGRTSITNFITLAAQCFPTPHMYHFLPGVAIFIASFSVAKDTVAARPSWAGGEHCCSYKKHQRIHSPLGTSMLVQAS